MTLADLYPVGTPLREVNPGFRGMPLKEWQREKVFEQGAEYRKTLNPADAPLSKQRIWTKRDGYGLKGI